MALSVLLLTSVWTSVSTTWQNLTTRWLVFFRFQLFGLFLWRQQNIYFLVAWLSWVKDLNLRYIEIIPSWNIWLVKYLKHGPEISGNVKDHKYIWRTSPYQLVGLKHVAMFNIWFETPRNRGLKGCRGLPTFRVDSFPWFLYCIKDTNIKRTSSLM